jgi:hypothetical protein
MDNKKVVNANSQSTMVLQSKKSKRNIKKNEGYRNLPHKNGPLTVVGRYFRTEGVKKGNQETKQFKTCCIQEGSKKPPQKAV